ncbi:Camk/cdpk protein kinase, partial [Globisporangium splendens]
MCRSPNALAPYFSAKHAAQRLPLCLSHTAHGDCETLAAASLRRRHTTMATAVTSPCVGAASDGDGIIPNEFVVAARVQMQRMMPVWIAKTRWLVLRGSKAPILAMYRHHDVTTASGECLFHDGNPLKVMILGDDTLVQVTGEKTMVLASSRVRKHETWVIAFASSGDRKRMYKLVKTWIELSAFLQTLTGFESIAKSNHSVVYMCHEQEAESEAKGQGAEFSSARSMSAPSSSSLSRRRVHRGRRFALKRVGKDQSANEIAMTVRATAIEILRPYLARYLYMYETSSDNSVTIVMPYYIGGSLADRIRDMGSANPLPEKIVRSVLSWLCCALDALHQQGILHLDVKAGNILFDTASSRTFTNLKLVDFGSAAPMNTGRTPWTMGECRQDPEASDRANGGTYGCMAPERFDGQYGPEADVYGAGVVLYHMVVGEIPFPGKDLYQVLVKNMAGKVSFASPHWTRVSASLRHLAMRILDANPATRITLPEILRLKWLFQNVSTHEPKLKEELSLATASASGRARKKDASVGVVMGPYRRRGESNSSYTKALGDIVVHPRRVAGSVETTFVGSRGNPGPGGTGSIIVRVHKDSHTASLIWAASMAYSRKDTTNNFAEYWGLIHGLREAQRSHFEPLYVIGDSALIISQQRMHRSPRQHRLARLYQTSRRLADYIDIRGWYHHYRAFNKMADSAANLAIDTRTSTQVHFPTQRAAFNNLTQDLDNDVMHWLMRSSEDPRSLDNTRQPHIGPREHAILVKDYLAFRSDLLQPAL